MTGDTDSVDLEELYDGLECGMCGDPIEPGEWCGNDDCPLGGDGPPSSRGED